MIRPLITLAGLVLAAASLAAADGHHHGEPVALGTATIGAWKVTAHRIGAWEPGEEGPATIDLAPAQPAAKAVRVWIGGADGRGATKTRGEKEAGKPGSWHCHVEVPDVPEPVPVEIRLWVAIESANGEQHTGSFTLTLSP